MKFIFRTTFFCLLFIFAVKAGMAQVSLLDVNNLSDVKIDLINDEQIESLYRKAQDMKFSDTELFMMMKEKGLPENELNVLKQRIEKLQANGTKPNKSEESFSKDDTKRTYSDKKQESPMQKQDFDAQIFGSELFQKNSMVFEPNIRIPAPSSYILGPDDELIVNVYGLSEKKYQLMVNEEGDIYIPNVGPVYVTGFTMEQATQKISNKLGSTIYSAIHSGKTKVQVSLGKIKSIRVTIIGQAQKPGTYTVSSLSTLYNVLYLCGGPTSKGSYRSIEVIRGNKLIRTADLYDFLIKGNQKDNVLLQEGDVVRIPYYKNRITVTGNVKRKGKYEVKEDELLSDVMNYCGGFDDNAYRLNVNVTRIADTGRIMVDVTDKDFVKFNLKGGDEVFVNKIRDNILNRVMITGSVARPGNYELSTGMTLLDLLRKSGGLLPEAFSKNASVFRYKTDRIPSIQSVDIDSVIQGQTNITLLRDDSIHVHSIFDFKDSIYVSIEGFVRKPKTIAWREDMSLRDVVMEAGGITSEGDSNRIEISRRVKNANVSQINHTETELIATGLSGNIQLEPFDYIVVKNATGYVTQRTVAIVGDVKSPGKMVLQRSGEKLTDVLKRAEGFKASADSNSITIRRLVKSNLSITERELLFQRLLDINYDSIASNQKLRSEIYKSYELISVNTKIALSDPASSENLILEDGDIITIEKNTKLVKISGEVYYPTTIPYLEGKRAKYYIKQAGNFIPSARKSGTLVIYPDGRAKSVKTFLFFKSYPSITSRSEIFIPQKNKNNRNRLSTSELALIVSALGVLANVLITALKK